MGEGEGPVTGGLVGKLKDSFQVRRPTLEIISAFQRFSLAVNHT